MTENSNVQPVEPPHSYHNPREFSIRVPAVSCTINESSARSAGHQRSSEHSDAVWKLSVARQLLTARTASNVAKCFAVFACSRICTELPCSKALENFEQQDYEDYLQRPTLCSEKFHRNHPIVYYSQTCQLCFMSAVLYNTVAHKGHYIK